MLFQIETKAGLRYSPVTLITPPSAFLLDERVFMTLGILRIAAVLENKGVPVNVLDLSGVANYQEAVQDYVQTTNSQTFGITATTPQLPYAKEISRIIRSSGKSLRTILGGPHVTLVNAALKKENAKGVSGRARRAMKTLEDNFDTLVSGDGEESIFLSLVDHAPKHIDADDPKSSLFLTNSKLNTLPWPARHLVDARSYHYQVDGHRAYSLIAQLGCPFECGFCGGRSSPMLRRVRTRTSQNIVDEMVHMYQTLGCTGFMFYDDELNVNPKMVELMQLISRTQKNLKVEWRLRGFVKAELFTDVQAESMYEAGFRWILTGFESGSPKILKNINKKASLEENTRCMEIAKRYDLKVKALMSIGHPGENFDTVAETKRWLLEVRPEAFDLTIITCYPGTPYYDEAVEVGNGVWLYTLKNGDRLYQYELDFTEHSEYYKGDPNGGYRAYVYTDELSSEEIVRLRGEVEAEARHRLGLPYDVGAPALRYEHSMGQGGLPASILRTSAGALTS